MVMDDVYANDSIPSKGLDVDIEVFMQRLPDGKTLQVRVDEDAEPVLMPRHRVTVLKRKNQLVTLRLPERKAIAYNLI